MKSIIVILVGIAAFIAVGYAGPFGGHGRGDRDGLRELLKLDDATAEKIGKLRDEHRKGQIALRARLDGSRVDFRSLMRADQPDEKQAMAKQKEMSSIRQEIQAAALAHRFAVGKLLTSEQRIVLREHAGGRYGMGDDDAPMKHGKRHHRQHGERMDDHEKMDDDERE